MLTKEKFITVAAGVITTVFVSSMLALFGVLFSLNSGVAVNQSLIVTQLKRSEESDLSLKSNSERLNKIEVSLAVIASQFQNSQVAQK